MKRIRSLRELTRILDIDRRLRRLCLIHGDEGGYPRSVISRFTRRVGADVLQLIIEEKVIRLFEKRSKDIDVLLDASFIKARSIRHPDNSRVAYSDPDALVGRIGRGYDLRYKLRVAVDHRTIMPLATLLAPANDARASLLFIYDKLLIGIFFISSSISVLVILNILLSLKTILIVNAVICIIILFFIGADWNKIIRDS